MIDTNTFAVIAPQMRAVETGLYRAVAETGPEIQAIAGYVFGSGGKRIRPALFLLVASQRASSLEPLISAAVGLELVHTASLLHDDVIDCSPERRGKPSINARWNNHVAVLAGDCLLARAVELFLGYRDWAIMEVLAGVVRNMAEGEITQSFASLKPEGAEERYFAWIGQKTAALFSGCCRMGSILSGGDYEEQSAWGEFGYCFGVAFQLVDDYLDYAAGKESTGKRRFGDLQNRVLTLPLIRALKMSTGNHQLRSFLQEDPAGMEKTNLAARVVLAGDGPAYTLDQACRYAAEARKQLSRFSFARAEQRSVFESLLDGMMERARSITGREEKDCPTAAPQSR